MPLINGSSREAVSENIRREMAAKKPQKQAVAIALDVARRAKRASGGPAQWLLRSEVSNAMHAGPINSGVPGRTDRHNMTLGSGAYVVPADIVSHLGQNNTQAGFHVLNGMFSGGPYGSSAPALHARKPRFAKGGGSKHEDHAGKPVDVVTAGGEYVIPPDALIQKFGSLDRAHKILDAWVLSTRKEHIKTLRKLPGPAKS